MHFSVLGPGGGRLGQDSMVGSLMRKARGLPHLAGRGGGSDVYFGNGSRLYVDNGMHPESATCETTSPSDAVRYYEAGMRILADLAGELAAEPGVGEVVLSRCNVSYRGDGNATHGRHESYSYSGDMRILPDQMIPFLVSRVLFCAGGLVPTSPGIEFTLSPRSHYLVKDVSPDSTANRGIFHTKDERLNRSGLHRVHLLCGDSLCSHLGNYVSIGSCALVIAAIEAGFRLDTGLQLRTPVWALRRLAADPTGRTARVKTRNGRTMTALEIQRHYLACVRERLDAREMPSWAPAVCRRWAEALDQVEQEPELLTTRLDAHMKLSIFKRRAARRHFAWEKVEQWTRVSQGLREGLRRHGSDTRHLSPQLVLGPSSPIVREVEQMGSFLRRCELCWDEFPAFLDLREELMEIDTRFGIVGEGGIFNHMDAACPAVLRHRIPEIDRIDEVRTAPPRDTRARLRGEQVARLWRGDGTPRGYRCAWEHIWDQKRGRVLDLSDLFATSAEWRAAEDVPEFGGLDELAAARRFLRAHTAGRSRRQPAEAGDPVSLPF